MPRGRKKQRKTYGKRTRFRRLKEGTYKARVTEAKLKGNQVIITFEVLGKGHREVLQVQPRQRRLKTEELATASLNGDNGNEKAPEPKKRAQPYTVHVVDPNSTIGKILARKQRESQQRKGR